MPNRSSRAWPRDVCGVPDLDGSMRAGEAGVRSSQLRHPLEYIEVWQHGEVIMRTEVREQHAADRTVSDHDDVPPGLRETNQRDAKDVRC